MRMEVLPNPKVVITFTHEELKQLRDSIEAVVADNKYVTSHKMYSIGTSLDCVSDFLREISKIL